MPRDATVGVLHRFGRPRHRVSDRLVSWGGSLSGSSWLRSLARRYQECEHICLHLAYIYNDTPCGEATRAVNACIGSQPTCDLYNDILNVHAEQYTCKAEKDDWASIAKSCGQSDEDPFPHGEP